MNSILEATKRRCVEEQLDARHTACNAAYYLEQGILGRAAQEQREAHYHADQAMTRLFRLIGTE